MPRYLYSYSSRKAEPYTPAGQSHESKPLVSIRDLHFSRGGHKVFDGIDVLIPQGKITAIMGPSGTGKTTLLQLIGGQLRPDRGTITVGGIDVHRLSRRALFFLRMRMGMLFQGGALFTDLSVFDNVAFPLREHTRLSEDMIRTLVLMKLQAVGLRGARGKMPRELSGGMARRVALARAMVFDPMMLMYDEPFTGQDPITMGILVQLIRRLNDALDLTSIVVSHDVAETAAIADYLYVLSEGKVVGAGTPDELSKTGSEWITQFMQGLPDGPVPFHYPARDYTEDLLS
uniref:Phospholipid/cholesterol/gamma-HCH transport system ATP-binding protein n=1 Tax=Candidatus Kentrum sp. FM TaxID=2126340 RepID=A0A450S293_9GAMM|nr:MAG: phospholipid/cholesterol/gamma-HCH transport system ATP-binding protein [Candidatus Kentron sp. FM]VFJ45781.1 MAG: phospholipid/cholesterol/gamma-HCH transport system ATP-binding protein [Candidatus Kentron sp. FM]VFK06999.1 MAG: phospholipid/cholesterol/gamma-HCH transport system ATP-binding protein [Candidatus Kentron sp. FM]